MLIQNFHYNRQHIKFYKTFIKSRKVSNTLLKYLLDFNKPKFNQKRTKIYNWVSYIEVIIIVIIMHLALKLFFTFNLSNNNKQ